MDNCRTISSLAIARSIEKLFSRGRPKRTTVLAENHHRYLTNERADDDAEEKQCLQSPIVGGDTDSIATASSTDPESKTSFNKNREYADAQRSFHDHDGLDNALLAWSGNPRALSPPEITPTTAVDNIFQLYRRLWFETQLLSGTSQQDCGLLLFKMLETVDVQHRDYCTRRGFESLLLLALGDPRAIDFLLQTCWQAMLMLPTNHGQKAFLQWLDRLPIVPQPKSPILGNRDYLSKQQGIVRTCKAKRSARIVTAAIISRCIALGILPDTNPITRRCHGNEESCLKGGSKVEDVDFVASCIYLRGCAKSWLQSNHDTRRNLVLTKVQKAVVHEWRYNSNISVRNPIGLCLFRIIL